MTGEETFQFAAAIAGVSIGLAAALILAVLAIIGTWRLFRHASEASLASTRATLAMEELARRLSLAEAGAPAAAAPSNLVDLRQQAEELLTRQQHLQEMARNLLDTAAVEGGQSPVALEEIEGAVSRLEGTVGQMAAALANLVQQLERQEREQ